MRPIHVVVLLLAGALVGALIGRVMHLDKRSVPVRVMAQAQPATAPSPPAERVPSAVAVKEPLAEEPPAEAELAKPSPMPPPARPVVRREAPKLQPVPAWTAPVPVMPAETPAPPPPPVEDPPPSPVPAPPAAPEPHQVTLNAGMLLPVRLVDGLSSERNAPGDAFSATLAQELVADGFVIAERGARLEGRVVAVDRAKVRAAALAVELTRLHTSDGQSVAIQTENYFQHASQVADGGKALELPSETMVTFRLKAAVPLTEKIQ